MDIFKVVTLDGAWGYTHVASFLMVRCMSKVSDGMFNASFVMEDSELLPALPVSVPSCIT